MTTATDVLLVRRPSGLPEETDFEFVDRVLPPPGEGEVEVENLFISVDPYMRGRMTGVDSYVTGFVLGDTMRGGAVGRVVRSNSPHLSPGDLVEHDNGWRTATVLPAAECRLIRPAAGVSPSAYLGILGMPGWTAYVGLREIASIRPGDEVFVSAASGAVGSAAGQIAAALGASRVVGSAGTAAKARALVAEYSFDDAFDYHEGPISHSLRRVSPDGIDLYFDNVGGEHLHAAWEALRVGGRVAVCGAIAEYNSDAPQSLPNVSAAISRRLSLRGFIVYDHQAMRPAFEDEVGAWVAEGRLKFQETVFPGIEASIAAFRSLFTGEKIGKVVVATS